MNKHELLSRLKDEFQLATAKQKGAEYAFTLQLETIFRELFNLKGIHYGVIIGVRRRNGVEKFIFRSLCINAYSQSVIVMGDKILSSGRKSKSPTTEAFRLNEGELSDELPLYLSVFGMPKKRLMKS